MGNNLLALGGRTRNGGLPGNMGKSLRISRSRPAARRGLSLVEILVVIVILIAGILILVQIFPVGFGGLRAASNSTTADRMAQQQLDLLTANPNGAPDGIYTQFLNTNGYSYFDPTVLPTNLSDYPTASQAYSAAADGAIGSQLLTEMRDLDKARYISNETFQIAGQVTTTATATTSYSTPSPYPLHVLNFAPVYVPNAMPTNPSTGTAMTPGDFVKAISGDWKATTADSSATQVSGVNSPVDVPQDLLTQGQPAYLVDYANERLAVAPEPYAQTFWLSVDVIDTSNNRARETIEFQVPAATNWPTSTSPSGPGDWFPKNGDTAHNFYFDPTLPSASSQWPGATTGNQWPTVPNANFAWVPGTARLYRPFAYQPNTSTFVGTSGNPADPYQYTLAANLGASDVNPGVIYFPASAAQAGIGTAITAKVTYSAYDWHMLHEDHDVSPSTSVRLTLGDLKKIGDTNDNGTLYTGLIPNFGGGNNYDVLLLNLDNGAVLPYDNSTTLDLDQNGSVTSGAIGISYRNGRIVLPSDFDPNVKHVRIFYTTSNDFGVAVQMAPANYVQDSSASAMTDITTVINNTSTGWMPNLFAADASNLYFPACDAGKRVRLSTIRYTDNGTPAVAHVLPQLDVLLPQPDTNGSYVGLRCTLPLSSVISGFQSLTSVGHVSGVSVTAVSVWRENGIWHRRSLETALGRS